jgi:hypothetical protein
MPLVEPVIKATLFRKLNISTNRHPLLFRRNPSRLFVRHFHQMLAEIAALQHIAQLLRSPLQARTDRLAVMQLAGRSPSAC